VPRSTTEEVVIIGCSIPAGARVDLCVAEINGASGDAVSMSGDGKIRPQRSWSFGVGRHRCPASNFARMELGAMLTEWLCRITEFELEPGFTAEIVFDHAERLTSLPLRWARSNG
jgi:cytochrome P450